MNHPGTATITLPVTVTRPPRRGGRPRWTAELRLDGYQAAEPYEAYGDTRADALSELTQIALRTLANTGRAPRLVVGGDEVPPGYLHLIIPDRDRFAVHPVHRNPTPGLRGRYPTVEAALHAVLRHTGANAWVQTL